MKVQELLVSIKRSNFDMKKELQIKEYLPIEEKKLIAQGIIYECVEEENGVINMDSVQRYLSYVKYMIIRHTNLEYKESDYDVLCSTSYGESNLLNGIMDCFGPDAQECSRILNLVIDDMMRENSIDISISKLVNKFSETIDRLGKKAKDVDWNSIIPENVDIKKLFDFLEMYK